VGNPDLSFGCPVPKENYPDSQVRGCPETMDNGMRHYLYLLILFSGRGCPHPTSGVGVSYTNIYEFILDITVEVVANAVTIAFPEPLWSKPKAFISEQMAMTYSWFQKGCCVDV
jgi:hypothetical protein